MGLSRQQWYLAVIGAVILTVAHYTAHTVLGFGPLEVSGVILLGYIALRFGGY